MSRKVYLVAGHGAGDPGAVGNGYQEADLARKIANSLYAKLKNKIDVSLYDTSKNLYKSRDYGSFKTGSYVVEIHLNSAAATATGTEILIKQGYKEDATDKALLAALAKYFSNRGVKYRSDLANMNNFASLGIGYVLVEVCFINNSKDVSTLLNNYDSIIADLTKALGGSGSTSSGSGSFSGGNAEDLYRVRKSWSDSASQKGAFNSLTNAKATADKNPGYSVYDSAAKVVYTSSGSSSTPDSSYKVKVTASVLNVRKGAGTSYGIGTTVKKGEVYTIVKVQNGWGQLKSGAGWICLDYAQKI